MTREERIRHIFLTRRRFTRARAAAALGKSQRWVDESRFEPENGATVEWREMVLMAYLLWSRVQIEKALGADTDRVFPRDELLVPFTVRVPRYKLIALRRQAKNRKLDLSELVADGIDVGYDEAVLLDRKNPGYVDAWHFPYPRYEDRSEHEGTQRRSRKRG